MGGSDEREPGEREPGGTAPRPDPGLGELFLGFFGAGMMGFGGVLPWARRMIVERRLWLTGPEFTDLLALCQFLPGPNVVNLAVAVGARFRGAAGAGVAVLALLAAPVCIVIGLGAIYLRYRELPVVRGAFDGLAAAASGLVLATACKIAWPLRARTMGVVVAVAAFTAVALLRLPLLPTVLALVPLSVVLMRRVPS